MEELLTILRFLRFQERREFKFGCPHQLTHTHKFTPRTTDDGSNCDARSSRPKHKLRNLLPPSNLKLDEVRVKVITMNNLLIRMVELGPLLVAYTHAFSKTPEQVG